MGTRRVSVAVLVTMVMGLAACSSSNDSQVIGGTPTPLPSPSPGATLPPPTTPVPGTPTPTMVVTPTPTISPTPTLTPMVYGVRDGDEIVRFSPTAPATVEALGSVGVDPATDPIVGLDRRPADDRLYAVSRSGRTFIVDVVSTDDEEAALDLAVTEIQSIVPAMDGSLPAARVGVDFNPAANALRLIGDDGQNFRVPTAALTNPAPDSGIVETLIDGRMGYRRGVAAAAYTNPVSNAPDPQPATALFVIDAEGGALYSQVANAGEMSFEASLSLQLSSVGGYDIFQQDAGGDNVHYVAATVGSNAALYRLDSATGELTLVRDLGAADVRGLVIRSNRMQPQLQAPFTAFVLDGSGESDVIIKFNFSLLAPNAGGLRSDVTIEGLMAGERIVGMDARTTSREPSRLDVIYAVTDQSRVVALLEGPNDTLVVSDSATLSIDLSGEAFGVDFNPAVDLLRIVSDTGQNLRVNLETGREIDGFARSAGFAVADRTTRVVSPAAPALPPQIVATAYRAAPLGGTFQFAIDAETSRLVRVAVPNDGALELLDPAVSLGVTLPKNADGAFPQSLDIAGEEDGLVLASLRPVGAQRSALYSINLDTGVATLIGSIGAPNTGSVGAITVRFE